MKKAYIVKRGDMVFMVSSNLKAAYECLVNHKSEMYLEHLRSYMQLTRIFKKVNYFRVPSNSGPSWEILLFPIVTRFNPKKP